MSLGDLVETITRGNVTEVKVILASVVLALAVYQLVLITVGYGVVRPSFLSSRAASFSGSANTTWLMASATQRYSPLAKSSRALAIAAAAPPM